MQTDSPDKKTLERLRVLQEKRREIMTLAPEDALERILDDPHPAALVHSFPAADFYFLVHDIGPEDSLPLLQLASGKQWDHIIDLETWRHERFDITAASRWMDLLLRAEPARFMRWALDERLDFIELYLWRNLEVRIREHDQDPSELGVNFFSLDNTYYVRIIDLPPTTDDSVFNEEYRQGFINKFLKRLADVHHLAYQSVLLEVAHILPSETEEEQLHWRNVRLAEKGFLPFDEAVGIYQPLTPARLHAKQAIQPPPSGDEAKWLPVPVYPFKALAADTHFAAAVQQIDAGDQLHRIQHEFANLCNRIIVADHRAVRDHDSLREVVKKACGYLSIGLEQLAPAGQAPDPRLAADQLGQHALGDLFRVGFGRALMLKWRAEKWLDDCWFAGAGLRLSFWGEQWMGILGGLLIKKPLFYDNYRTGQLYREFCSTKEIAESEQIFEQIKAVDELLSLMSIDLKRPSNYGFLTYKNLLLTLWARHHLGLTAKIPTPLGLEAFRLFLSQLLPGGDAPGSDEVRCIPETMKQSFLDWLSAQTGLKTFEINAKLGHTFAALFAEIVAELSRVEAARIDPRFVNLFLLEQPSERP